jgi:hypothetical protein
VSSDPTEQPSGSAADSRSTPGEPSEEELRAAYEAELSRITPADMMLQAAVSLLNLGARRLGLTGGGDRAGSPGTSPGAPGDTAEGAERRPGEPAVGAAAGAERDLAQVRDAIDGVKALLEILERSMPGELRPLRDALSQLQIAYARETQAGRPADQSGEQPPPGGGKDEPGPDERPDAPGPAQSSGKLWVPGS